MNFNNNTFSIITGATGGLGNEISKKLINNKSNILFIGRKEEKINLFENNLKKDDKIYFNKLTTDLSSELNIKLIENTVENFLSSNKNINEIYLFNNASTIEPIELIENISYNEFLNSFLINLSAAYCLSSSIIRLKKKYKISSVKIINISSGVSINPLKGWSNYCITKSGLNTLSKCISEEYGDSSVFSVSINPGPIDTNMQKIIRSADNKRIPIVNRFIEMYREGKLQSPIQVTEKLFKILNKNDAVSNGDFIDFNKIN